ncbi:SDR family oxidoreductase [Streptomyces sp. NPDC004050]
MRVAVIGGTGLIGSQVVKILNAAGHEAVPHAQSTGVDVISGQGLDEAVAKADVVVNLTNSPTFDDASAAFFQTSMDNLVAAARKGGVGHFVILSIVGADQVPELDYYRAKVLQEDVLAAGPIPYSIVRATGFMEFVPAVLSWTTDGDTVRLPSTPIQPIASKDVADAVAEIWAQQSAEAPVHSERELESRGVGQPWSSHSALQNRGSGVCAGSGREAAQAWLYADVDPRVRRRPRSVAVLRRRRGRASNTAGGSARP